MQNSDTTHDAPAPLSENQLGAIVDAIGIYQRQQRTFAGITRSDQETLANCTNRLIEEVRAQRSRLAAQDRVVEAARRVVRYHTAYLIEVNGQPQTIVAPHEDNLNALQQALAALESST